MFAAAAALSACTTPPPYGTNEPPDAIDRIRAVDLRPHDLQPSGATDTGMGGAKPQLYFGSGDGQVNLHDSASAPPGAAISTEGVSLNFEDAPVTAVAKVILGDILGLGYSVDPRVQGTISLSSGRPVPKSDVLFVLESALRTSNAVLVHDAGGYRIVPADDATGSGLVYRGDRGSPAEPGYGISVVPLRHISVQTVMKLLDSFATKPGAIRAEPGKNILIVSGSGIERRTAVDTILSFDADWMRGQSVGIFPVKNSTPEPMITELEKIMDSGEEGLGQHLVKFQPVARSNAILAVASKPELLRTVSKWISRLDSSAVANTGVKVYRVRFGDAKQIAKVLNDLFVGGASSSVESATNQLAPGAGTTGLGSDQQSAFGGTGSGGGGFGGSGGGGLGGGGLGGGGTGGGTRTGGTGGFGGGGGAGGGQSQSQGPFGALSPGGGQSSGAGGAGADSKGDAASGGSGGGGSGRALLQGARIIPDLTNNAIVIYANAEQYRIIERALNQLDRPQAQVAIDVTVAEVHLTNDLRYGVQAFLGSLNTLNSFSNGVQAINTTDGKEPATQPGFNLMIGSKLTPHVIINALNAYTTTKILSNPSLVVIDNHVASLLVGQQVPVTSGASSTSIAVFSSIQYQDTGIVLHIHPRIYANGEVNLEISQEISAVDQAAGNSNCGTQGPCPTFNNRKVKSTIMVPDGQTVLLAGLIGETRNKSRTGVPGLEQIPFLGEAFSPSNANDVDRQELIMFIRPQIIRNSVDASTVAEELRAKVRGDKIGTLNPPGNVTPYPLGLVQ